MKDSNRSDNFDYFSDGSSEKAKKKDKLKKVWFWIRVVLYTLIFAISLTGCIQSFTRKSSNYSGTGTEIYTSKKKISPVVSTFVAHKDKDSGAAEGEWTALEVNSDANFHLSYKNYGDTLAKLREQANVQQKGDYGKWGSYTSSIQIINPKDKNKYITDSPVYKVGNQYLFMTSTGSKYVLTDPGNYNETIVFNPSYDFDKFYIYDKSKKEYTLNEAAIKNNEVEVLDKNGSKIVDRLKTISIIKADDPSIASNAQAKYNADLFHTLYVNTFTNEYYNNALKELNNTLGFSAPDYNNLVKTLAEEYAKPTVKDSLKNLSPKTYNALHTYLNTLKSYEKIAKVYAENNKANFITTKDKKGEDVLTKYYTDGAKLSFKNSIALTSTKQCAFTSAKDYWKLGPFFGFFVWPIGATTAAMRESMPNLAGWSSFFVILIGVFITRLISLGITWKALVNQSKQDDIKSKKAKIDAKYAEFKDNKQMKQRHAAEVQELYKKYGINPLDSFLTMIVSLPIFLAMWRVIQSIPEIKSTHWLGMDFVAVSWRKLFAGHWQYLGILVLAVGVQAIAQYLPRLLNRKKFKERTSIEEAQALRKADKTQNIMMGVFLFITLIFSAGVQIYWVLSGLWTICQTLIIWQFKKSEYYRNKYGKKASV